jgi:hypothetical protein
MTNASILTPDWVRRLRFRAQHLERQASSENLLDVVRDVCGIQAQQSAAMLLALRARIRNLQMSDVEDAITCQRSLVRTWAMRGTLHLLHSEDVLMFLNVLSPINLAKDKARRLQLGLDDDLSKRGLDALRGILSDTPLTRDVILEQLLQSGIGIAPEGQALIHLLMQAGAEQMLCCGPDTANGKSTFVLLDQWLGQKPPLPQQQSLSIMAVQYLSAYGPAHVNDFAAWSGLPMKMARAAWDNVQDMWVEAHLNEQPIALIKQHVTWLNDMNGQETHVRLLAAFDPYVLGYANRDDLVPPQHHAEVYHGGQTVPVIMLNGLAVGVWRYKREPKRLTIFVRTFDTIDDDTRSLIAEEVDDIGRFFKRPITLEWSS